MSDWDEITSFANLCRAAKRAARCKRRVAGAARFLERLEPEALALQRELLEGRWRPSQPVQFTIHDPKERVITAAPFPHRVVHHALVDPLEARLDAALVPQSFACRRGLGTHKALAHARELVRRHSHFLKLDIARCFESIGHELVLTTMAPLVGDAQTLELCRRVLSGSEHVLGRGLPIGNLTSQWFANLVLGRIDRFVFEELRVPGYVRYMDDFALFADDKQELRADFERIEDFVRDDLSTVPRQRTTTHLALARGSAPELRIRHASEQAGPGVEPPSTTETCGRRPRRGGARTSCCFLSRHRTQSRHRTHKPAPEAGWSPYGKGSARVRERRRRAPAGPSSRRAVDSRYSDTAARPPAQLKHAPTSAAPTAPQLRRCARTRRLAERAPDFLQIRRAGRRLGPVQEC